MLFTVHKLSRFTSFPSLASPSSVVINFVFLLLARQCSSKLAIALSRSSVRHNQSELCLCSRCSIGSRFGNAQASLALRSPWRRFRSMTARRETDAFTGGGLTSTLLSINSRMCRGIRSTTLRNRADKLQGEDRNILKLRPGITGPASLKYRDEEEMLASVEDPIRYNDGSTSLTTGTVIYPDKVRLNRRMFLSPRRGTEGVRGQSQACLSYGLQGGGKPKVNLYYYHYSLTCGRACSCSAIGKQACHCSRVLAAFWTDGFDSAHHRR